MTMMNDKNKQFRGRTYTIEDGTATRATEA